MGFEPLLPLQPKSLVPIRDGSSMRIRSGRASIIQELVVCLEDV